MAEKKTKKILIIGLTERMGGVETFIYNTTIFSNKEKYEYDYLVHGADHCVFQREISDFYGNKKHIYFIRKIKSNPIGWFIDITKFYRNNGKKYDYIHLQTGAASESIYAIPFCKLYGIKLISHSHAGSGYNVFINSIFRMILNISTVKRIACSREAANWLFGKKSDKAIILNNGIDTNRFRFNQVSRDKIRNKYGIKDEFVVGHIGRFAEEKNHPKLIAIFKKILESIPDSKLMLVGVGNDLDKIKNMVITLGIDDKVLFVGKQMNTEEFYSAFDVFVMPSLFEGLPITGIEAQCSGLNCFFSDRIDQQILITDKAKMIPLDNSEEQWAKVIVEGYQETDRYKYALEIDEKGYSIKAVVDTLEKVYEA